MCKEEFATNEALQALLSRIFRDNSHRLRNRGHRRYRSIRSLDEPKRRGPAEGTKEDIIASLQMKLPEVIQCYETQLEKDPTLSDVWKSN